MIDLGIIKPGSTQFFPFDTFGSNGESLTMSGLVVGDIKIFKDGGVVQRASTSGFTLLDTDGIDFDGITGIHGYSIDFSDNTTAGFYEAGSKYFVVIDSVTVNTETVSFVHATFELGYPNATLNTTIDTLSTQTSFTLPSGVGSGDDDAYNGWTVLVHDIASAVQIAYGYISDYTGTSRTITLDADPAIFTMAAGDNISLFPPANAYAVSSSVTAASNLDAVLTGTGATADVDLSARSLTLNNDVGEGLTVAGGGANAGMSMTGGATGVGLHIVGGATAGVGVWVQTTSGSAISAVGGNLGSGMRLEGGASGNGFELIGGATSGDAMRVTGGGNGDGIHVVTTGSIDHAVNLDANGSGATALKMTSSLDHAMEIIAFGAGDSALRMVGGDDAPAVLIEGSLSGAGVNIVPGATGDGVVIAGGATSGDGVNVTTTSGNGVTIAGGGASAGMSITGGATGIGLDINGGATSGTGLEVTSPQGLAADFSGLLGGVLMDAGFNGIGLDINGGSSSGAGLDIRSSGSGSAGIYVQCTGVSNALDLAAAGSGAGLKATSISGIGVDVDGGSSGAGVSIQGGATGIGLDINGGATSGEGLTVTGGGSSADVTGIFPATLEEVRGNAELVARFDNYLTGWIRGTSDSGTTTTMIDAARTESITDFSVGSILVFINGTLQGQAARITAFDPATDTTTFTPAVSTSVTTEGYVIIPEAPVEVSADAIDNIWDEVLDVGGHNVADSAGRRLRNIQEGGFYEDAAVWVDTVSGTAGTEDYENGTQNNPVASMADANTIATSIGLSKFRIVAGSTITLGATQADDVFIGENWSLDLNGQNIDGSEFVGAISVTGTGTNTAGKQHFIQCDIGTATLPEGTTLSTCALGGTLTIGEAGDFVFEQCYSAVAGSSTPVLDFGAALNSSNVSFRHYSGGVEIQNMGAGTGTYNMSLEGQGQLVINANCSATSNISIRGNFDLTNNASGITISDDPRYAMQQEAVDNLEASMVGGGVISGSATGTPTTTSMDTDITGYLDDELIGRIITWTTGTAAGQQAEVTDYANTNGVISYNTITTAPVAGDAFVIT